MSPGKVATPTADGEQSRPSSRELLAHTAEPLRRFLSTEAGSAGVMLGAVVVALAWANSPLSGSYESLWETELSVRLGGADFTMDLGHWVSDGLMGIFFLVIGLEVRRELSVGELTERRLVVLPVLGALGGMAVPALLYLAIAPSGEAADGWGIVVATDTAFVLGALAIVGPALSSQLRVFLLSVAVFDDVVAVAIIGFVYSESLDLVALAVAGVALAVIAVLARRREWRYSIFALVLAVLWVATVESGLHASIAGMLAGLLIGARPVEPADLVRLNSSFRAFTQAPLPDVGYSVRKDLQRTVSINERLQVLLHPAVAYVIVPLFVLANAGVDLRGGVLGDALESPVTWGIVAGLVGGKLIGIGAATLATDRLGLGSLPEGVGKGQVIGGAALSGIGFTVSLLIANLAFDSAELVNAATVGVLLAAILATAMSWVAFRLAAALRGERTATRPMKLDREVDREVDHIRGPFDAPLTLVEYADFQCPFCGQVTDMSESLRDRFGDELRYVFRHLPLPDVHPDALLAAEAAEAAGAQGKFWEMHDRLFDHQDQLDPVGLFAHAAALGLDVERFSRELGSRAHARRVRADAGSAQASGATGTPTFFVNGRRQVGRYDEEALAAALTGGEPPAAAEPEEAGRPRAVGPGYPSVGRLRQAGGESAPLVLEGLAETADEAGMYPRLTGEQIATLRTFGESREIGVGEPLLDGDEPAADLVVVLSGAVAVVDGYGQGNRIIGVHGPGQFLGGLGVLSGEAMILTPVGQQAGEVLAVSSERLPEAFATDIELRDVIQRTFLLRRAYVLGRVAVQIIGPATSRGTQELRALLDARDVVHSWLDPETDEKAATLLEELGIDPKQAPVAITRDRRVLQSPTRAELAEALDLPPAEAGGSA